jgi:hypothetical protein
VSKKMMMLLLALVLALVLGGAATALAASPSASDSAKGTLGKVELSKNKDFSGLVGIGGGRKMYMECHGRGAPTVVLVSGARGAYDDWTHVIDSGGEPRPSRSAVFPGSASSPGSAPTIVPGPRVWTARCPLLPRCASRPPRRTEPRICMPC